VWKVTHGDEPFDRPGTARPRFQAERRAHKKAAVTKALQEFVARRQQRRLLDLFGKLEWDESFDYKAERSRR
jgi:hypothetical protein